MHEVGNQKIGVEVFRGREKGQDVQFVAGLILRDCGAVLQDRAQGQLPIDLQVPLAADDVVIKNIRVGVARAQAAE